MVAPEQGQGWHPQRGIPPAAGSPLRNTPLPSHMRGTASSVRMGSPRGSKSASKRGQRSPRGPTTKKEVINEQRKDRMRDHGAKAERSCAARFTSNTMALKAARIAMHSLQCPQMPMSRSEAIAFA